MEAGRVCEFCKGTERLLGFSFKRCSQCLVTYYCSVDCQTKDWERRHSRECKKALASPVPVLPAPKLPKRRQAASQSITAPPASSSVLGPADLKCLAKNMNLNENWLTKCLQDESSLMNLKASDLRTILCFLRDNCNRKNIRVSGNKSDLVRSVFKELHTNSGVDTASQAFRAPFSGPPLKRRKVGPNAIEPPPAHPTAYASPLDTDITKDVAVLLRQNPYYAVQQQLLTIPFGPYAKIYTHRYVYKRMFSLDAETFNEMMEQKRQNKPTLAVHIRLISIEKRDIGWDHTFNLTCNGGRPDLSKNEKKIRQLKMLNPFVTPFPADITPLIEQANNNLIEFSIPRTLSGVAVVQLVRKVNTEELLATVKRASVEASRATNKAQGAGDLEETGVIVSLRCPLSYCKIQFPAKGLNCSHIQCFDAKFFLEYCSQQLVWNCPVCNDPLPYTELLLDEYFEQMLSSVTSEEMKVMVLPDGSFSVPPNKVAAVAPKKETMQKDKSRVVEICLEDSGDEGEQGKSASSNGMDVPKETENEKEGSLLSEEEEDEEEMSEDEECWSDEGSESAFVGSGVNSDPIVID